MLTTNFSKMWCNKIKLFDKQDYNQRLRNDYFCSFMFKKNHFFVKQCHKCILQLTGNIALNRWVINDAPPSTAFSPSLKFAIECPRMSYKLS